MYERHDRQVSFKLPAPLILIGLFGLFLSGSAFLKSNKVGAWEEIPATISQVDMETKKETSRRRTKSGRYRTSTSTTHHLHVRYTYEYDEQEYRGVFKSSSSLFSIFEVSPSNAYDELKDYEETGDEFRCFVNTDDPSESTLYNEYNRTLMMLTLMGSLLLVGIGAVIFFKGNPFAGGR